MKVDLAYQLRHADSDRTQTIVYSTLKLQWFEKYIYWSIIKTFGVRKTSVKTTKIVTGTDATLWRSVHKEYNSEL